MKRRIISCLLIVALFLAIIPNTVYAQEIDQRYTQDQMDAIVQKYDYNEDMLNSLFCVDTAVGYWGMANNIKQNGVLAWALDMSSRLIGEYPEKQDYAEMLANLITMQTGELAEQIETQSRFDDLKDVGDYAWDVIEIAAAFVGASGALETISAAIDTGVSGVGDVIIKNNEQAKYYEVTLQEYSQSDAFLHAISKNAENEELRNVATSLLRANETLLVKRLEYLADAGANIAEYEAEFFIKNMSMELLKEADLYVTDETVKFFVDEGISLKNAILAATDAAKFAFKMVILAGDIGFGTSDVYNRYQEMKAVADIAASLVKTNKDIYVPNENTQETLEVIQGKCNLYKALIVTHARGEYLLYQLLMNDAGALSDIRWIIEYFKNPEETTEAWYDGQIEVLTKYCNILDEMFVLPQKDDEGTNEADVDLLTVENQYELNCFLSYFSQQWFNEVDPKTYEVKTDSFDVQNADPVQLIRFVHLYTKINNNQVLSDSLDQDSKVHLSFDYINNKLQQFFGISILSQDVQNSGYELRDGNIYFDFAMGETYNYMTVARSLDEVSSETFRVEFDVYRGEGKYRYAGGPIVIEDVYGYSTEDAQQDADLIYYKSGTATVRQVRNGNKIAYQLLQYGLEEQSQSRDDISFSDIPSEFVFSSGAGGWGTYLTIEADGSFKGEYHDSEMGLTGEGYSRGTVYICGFDGKFSEPQKVSEYVYSMKLESLNVKESAGTEYIENDIRYIVSEPYGMENADEFYIYLPGASMAELPKAFLSWTHIDRDIRDTLPSGYYGIYNAGGEKGFTATEDDCIWNKDYMYYYQNQKAAMWPRYYGMSHVLFWPESGAAVIDLQFAWRNDNQTEFVARDENGSGEYRISFDISGDMSTVNVSVTSVNGVNLSSWGGTSDGHFTATFVDE